MNFKIFSVFVVIGFIAWSPKASATHAYASMQCRSTEIQFRYKGNYPFGGDYGIARSNVDVNQEGAEEFLALPSDDADDRAVVFFTEKSSITNGEVKKSCDEWFDHEEWKSTKVIKIDEISEKASKALGLKQGQSMTVECEETYDMPNGGSCGK